MISILPSEGLAPTQSAPKPNKPSDPSSNSDEPSFSSLVSRDSPENNADQNSDAPAAETAPPAQTDRPETAAQLRTHHMSDAAEQTDPAFLKSENVTVLQDESSAQQKASLSLTSTPVSTETPTSTNASLVDALTGASAVSEASPAGETKRAQAAILPGAVSGDPAQAAKAPIDSTAQVRSESAPEVDVALRTATQSAADGTDPKLQATLQSAADAPAEDNLRIIRQQDGADIAGPDVKLSQLAKEADSAATLSKSALATATGETRATAVSLGTPDAVLSVAQPTSTAAPTAPSGLTPVAPSIPVAAPSEINSIVLNALRNGAEPREQLIVQLDPPELGRVAIDFKFDAQGLQQITVTSENPEALRRLRELHFELTEALKEHGLSEQNLSFRQQADDQSQRSWQMAEGTRPGDVFTTVENPPAAPQSIRSNVEYTNPDRLDLTL